MRLWNGGFAGCVLHKRTLRVLATLCATSGLFGYTQAQFDLFDPEPELTLPQVVIELISDTRTVVTDCPESLAVAATEHGFDYACSYFESDTERRARLLMSVIDARLTFASFQADSSSLDGSLTVVRPWTQDRSVATKQVLLGDLELRMAVLYALTDSDQGVLFFAWLYHDQ